MTFQKYSRRYLAEFVYGAIDGTVTTFAIISAVSGATLSWRVGAPSSRSTFFSFVSIGSLPVWPFAIFYASKTVNPFMISILTTGLVFLLIGYARGYISGRSGLAAAMETLLVGALAAAIAYFVGAWLQGLVVS